MSNDVDSEDAYWSQQARKVLAREDTSRARPLEDVIAELRSTDRERSRS